MCRRRTRARDSTHCVPRSLNRWLLDSYYYTRTPRALPWPVGPLWVQCRSMRSLNSLTIMIHDVIMVTPSSKSEPPSNVASICFMRCTLPLIFQIRPKSESECPCVPGPKDEGLWAPESPNEYACTIHGSLPHTPHVESVPIVACILPSLSIVIGVEAQSAPSLEEPYRGTYYVVGSVLRRWDHLNQAPSGVVWPIS